MFQSFGYVSTFGKDEPMGAYDDIYHSDCFFIIGSNMAEAHPVIFRLVNERKQKDKNVKIIMVDPRKTLSARIADLHMSFIPGTDLAILHAMAHVIIKENLYSKDYVNNHVVFKTIKDDKPAKVSFEEYVKFLDEYTPEAAEKISKCPKEDIIKAARWFAQSKATIGQSERRYQYLEKAVEPPGEARPDLDVMIEFAHKLFAKLGRADEAKKLFNFKNSEDVWNEMRQCSKGTAYDFMGMTRERLKKAHGIQWPCPTEDHPGTVRRYTAKYGDVLVKKFDPHATDVSFYGAKADDNKATIWLRPYKGPAEPPDEEYPFILTTGRQIEHWHTGTMTLKVPELKRSAPDAYVEINPKDAQKLGIKTKDKVRLTSRRGSIVLEARVVDVPREGLIFVPMHYPDKLINLLTTDAYDAMSKQPEFKICAVKIERT